MQFVTDWWNRFRHQDRGSLLIEAVVSMALVTTLFLFTSNGTNQARTVATGAVNQGIAAQAAQSAIEQARALTFDKIGNTGTKADGTNPGLCVDPTQVTGHIIAGALAPSTTQTIRGLPITTCTAVLWDKAPKSPGGFAVKRLVIQVSWQDNQNGKLVTRTYPQTATISSTVGDSIPVGVRNAASDGASVTDPIPVAPVISGSENAAHNVPVSWAAIANVDGYTVQTRVNSSTWTTVATNQAGTSYTVPSTYSDVIAIRVQAVAGSSTSAWSNVLNVTISAPPVVKPAIPNITSSGPDSAQNAVLTWNAVPGATGYMVEYMKNGGTWTIFSSNQTSTTATIPAYYRDVIAVHVQAIKGSQTSGWSSTVNISIPNVAVPAVKIGDGWGPYLLFGNGDVNIDGHDDISAVDSSGQMWIYKSAGTVSPIVNGQSPTFFPRYLDGSGWQIYNKLISFRKQRDLFAIDSSGTMWYYAGHPGTPGYQSPRIQVGTGWLGMDFVSGGYDYNGDGVPDILASFSGQLYMYPGVASNPPSFQKFSSIVVGATWNQYVSVVPMDDLNGDGKPDLLAFGADGNAWFLAGTGSNSSPFKSPVRLSTMTSNPTSHYYNAGDLDGDGVKDLIEITSTGDMVWRSGALISKGIH